MSVPRHSSSRAAGLSVPRRYSSKGYGLAVPSKLYMVPYRPPPFLGTWNNPVGMGVKKKKISKKTTRKRSINRNVWNTTKQNMEFSTTTRKNILKPKFVDIPLSNHELMAWVNCLEIPNFKGIYSRNEFMPKKHSPCIINLDDMGSQGTHWVCCAPGGKNILWYFDSFGMHYPKEYEKRAKQDNKKVIYDNIPYQNIYSVRCGYYVLYFLHRWALGEDFYDILKRFHIYNTNYNEKFIKTYFISI